MSQSLNTSDQFPNNSFLETKEMIFIGSLIDLPLLVVLRAEQEDLEANGLKRPIFRLLRKLTELEIKHVEIAWSEHPCWSELIRDIQKCFPRIVLGTSSVTTQAALHAVSDLGISYAMSPFWDLSLLAKARELNQLLIPGVFSPSEIQQACTFGCRLIKLFPAASLGINYWSQIQPTLCSPPFVIAAGGMRTEDLVNWISKGYNAIALGRSLFKNGQIDPNLKLLITKLKNNPDLKRQSTSG